MIYIQNDDDAYITWLERNEQGFVANLGTGGKTHTGTCPKACSQNRDDIERWLRAAQYTLVVCSPCLP